MKYLFITLTVRQSEYEHTHRVLTTTDNNNILEAADEYVGGYWDEKAEKNEDGRWEAFGCEMMLWVDKVVELTKDQYTLMSKIFSCPTGAKINTFFNIDWAMLKDQKNALLTVINHVDGESELNRGLQGILQLLDNLQDYAVDVLGEKEDEIFDFNED